MLQIRLICVGKLKERFYADAAEEYLKRLSAFCKLEIEEIAEARLSENPSAAELGAALQAEAESISDKILKNSAVVALCVEGAGTDSPGFAALLERYASAGVSKLTFVIGGSNGLHPDVKAGAGRLLSMSRMTFPHHLARILLLEQLYRAFTILGGGKYHK